MDSTNNAKQWLKDNKEIYIYVEISLVSIEFLCIALGLIYRASEHVKETNKDIKYSRFDTKDLMLDSGDNYGSSDNTNSASKQHREDMKAKYSRNSNNSLNKQNSLQKTK